MADNVFVRCVSVCLSVCLSVCVCAQLTGKLDQWTTYIIEKCLTQQTPNLTSMFPGLSLETWPLKFFFRGRVWPWSRDPLKIPLAESCTLTYERLLQYSHTIMYAVLPVFKAKLDNKFSVDWVDIASRHLGSGVRWIWTKCNNNYNSHTYPAEVKLTQEEYSY